MEFNDLLTKAAHEDGAEVSILNPSTGEDTGFKIRVLGVDSTAFQKAQRKIRMQAIKALTDKKEITIEDEIASEIDHLVSITIGWSGIEHEGKSKPFSVDACRQLYTDSPGLRQQVDRFVSDRRNFIKG